MTQNLMFFYRNYCATRYILTPNSLVLFESWSSSEHLTRCGGRSRFVSCFAIRYLLSHRLYTKLTHVRGSYIISQSIFRTVRVRLFIFYRDWKSLRALSWKLCSTERGRSGRISPSGSNSNPAAPQGDGKVTQPWCILTEDTGSFDYICVKTYECSITIFGYCAKDKINFFWSECYMYFISKCLHGA